MLKIYLFFVNFEPGDAYKGVYIQQTFATLIDSNEIQIATYPQSVLTSQ